MRAISILSALFMASHSAKLDFVTSSSSICRKKCLNQAGNFCVTPDFSEGVCCEFDVENCGGSVNSGFCSSDIVEQFTGLEYWVCPRESFCQDQINVAQTFG